MTTPSEPRQSGGNVFTRKIGPLSMWVWMLIALAIAVTYYLYKKNSANSTTSNQNTAANTPGGTDSSLVPQFVNQTYTDVSPPSVTVNNNQTNNNNPPTSSKPPAPKPKPPPPKKKPPTTKGGQQYTTVTVGQWPSGSGGSPSASQSGGNAAWNSTLWGIATHYNVKGGYQALAKLNSISDPSLIYPGQKIKVPISG